MTTTSSETNVFIWVTYLGNDKAPDSKTTLAIIYYIVILKKRHLTTDMQMEYTKSLSIMQHEI